MFDYIEKHPIVFTILICLLLFLTAGIFYNAVPISDFQASYLIFAGILASCTDGYNKRIGIILATLFLFLLFLTADARSSIYLIGEYGILSLFTFLNKSRSNIFIFAITAAAFLLHLHYIQYTPVNIRQHDINGIMLYMKQITQNGLNILQFDPWHMYYLFHQPLHFIFAGYLLSLELYLWNSNALALEGVQYLSLLYVTLTTITAAAIFKELHIVGKPFYALLLLFAFNPTLTLFSGYLSDDAPAVFWSVCVVYFIIRWYKAERAKDIVFAAVCFGFGVLTKLSVLMMVPAVCFIFAYKLFFTLSDRQKTLQQISCFIIVAVPLALLWIIRNHILFDMQFFNIPDTSPAGQNFKYLTLTERIGDFSMFSYPFLDAPKVNDANIFLALIKTELFGEWDFSIANHFVYLPALILYVLNISIKFLAFAGCLSGVKNSTIEHPFEGMFAILYLTIWLYALKYALDYPYICSTDFRLFAQLMLPEAILLFAACPKIMKNAAFPALSISYAALSCFIYLFGI